MVVGKWGFVCFLMIVGKLTNSLNLNGTTKTVLETNVQKDEATSKNETKTGIARNTTGSSKDNGGTVTVKTFNVDKASTRLPDMKENKASISEYQYMEITSSPNTVKAVNLDKLRLASTSETVTSGYSEKTPKTDTPISNETRQRTLSSTEAYIDQTSKIPMSRDATESSTSHEKQTTVSEDIDTTSKSAEGPSKDNGGTVTVNTFNVDKASTRLPDMKENKASIWEYPYMEITSSPNTVKAVYLVKLRLAPASASETVASGYSDKITLSSVIETVTSEYSGKTPKTDAVGYSSTKSQLVFTSETGLQAISADPNTVTVTLPFAIPPGFSKQSAVNTDTVIHASTTPISNETRQRTLSSTEAYVDQSSKIPMSRDATESSTRHEKQTTVSEDVDKSAEDQPQHGEVDDEDRTLLIVVAAVGVWMIVLVFCCVFLFIKNRKRKEYLPSNASHDLRARGKLPSHGMPLPCFEEYMNEINGDECQVVDSKTESGNISPISSKSFHRDNGYSSFLTKKHNKHHIPASEPSCPPVISTTYSGPSGEENVLTSEKKCANRETKNEIKGDIDDTDGVGVSDVSQRTKIKHLSDPDVILRQSFHNYSDDVGKPLNRLPTKNRPKSVQVTSI